LSERLPANAPFGVDEVEAVAASPACEVSGTAPEAEDAADADCADEDDDVGAESLGIDEGDDDVAPDPLEEESEASSAGRMGPEAESWEEVGEDSG
jgi:hypothetical protein